MLDAAAAGLATIRGTLSADDRALLDQLGDARATLSKLAVAGAQNTQDFAKEVAALEDRIRKLEVSLGQNSAAYRVARQPVELAAVQRRVPRDARLVDIASFEPRDGQASYPNATALPRRYVAYVLASHGDPVAIDLGPVQPIDDAIGKLRAVSAGDSSPLHG